MTLVVELKNELRKIEQTRKEFETKVAALKQKETRIRQLAAEFVGPSAVPTAAHRPMPEEHRRKISEALKRRHSQSKSA
jgi:hypothetical protein